MQSFDGHRGGDLSLPRSLLSGVLLTAVLGVLVLGRPVAAAEGAEVAEGWAVRNWGLGDGLPVAGINALARGPAGYLWLATFDGLVRFDGVRFSLYGAGSADDLPSSRFTALWVGRHGLWLATETRHLVRFREGRFSAPRPEAEGDGFLRAATRAPDGRLVFAIGSKLFPEDPDGLGPPMAGVTGERLRSVAFGHAGTLWLGTLEGTVWRRRWAGLIEPVVTTPARSPVTALLGRSGEEAWIGTEDGLLHWRAGELTEVSLGPRRLDVLRLEEQENGGGGVWAATSQGVFHVQGERTRALGGEGAFVGEEPILFPTAGGRWLNTGRSLLLDGQEVLRVPTGIKDLLLDPEGSLWVATSRSGLLRLRPSPFETLAGPEGPLSVPAFPIVEGPPGTVWAGFANGTLARFVEGEAELLRGLPGGDAGPVWTVLPDPPHGALVGGSGLWATRGDRLRPVAVPAELADATILALFRDREGTVWAGTGRRGVFRRGPEGRWLHTPPGRDGLPDASATIFVQARDGTLWLGTQGGGLLRRKDGAWEQLSREEGFPSNLVRDLWEDGSRALWVATEDRGVVRVRLRRGDPLSQARVSVVGPRQGLLAPGVHRIVPDRDGNVWMSSNRGIFRVRKADLVAVADGRLPSLSSVGYTEGDGLPSREANGGVQSAGLLASDGRLWFPTGAGVVVFDPDRVVANPRPPPVGVEGVRLPGRRELMRPASEDPLRLAKGARTFEVWYTALAFAAPERVRFRYRIEGLTDGWIDADDRRQILLADVPPGRYRFEVTAANEHGVWNEAGTSLDVVVPPWWWETRTARVAGALVLMLAVAGGLVARAGRQRRRQRHLAATVEARTVELADALQQVSIQAETLRELDAARSRFFAHVSHELRTPLTLLVGPLLDAEVDPRRLVEEAPIMRRSAQALLRMVDQILDLEKAAAGRLEIHTEPRDLSLVARRVVETFAALARQWGVLLAADAPLPGPVAALDVEQMERATANLVSNAMRFTSAGGRVLVGVREEDGMALLEVSDSGRGIPPEALERIFERFYQVDQDPGRTRGTGIGLALVRELVELHGGEVEAESEVGRGTTFRLRLPCCAGPPVPPADDVETRSGPSEASGEREVLSVVASDVTRDDATPEPLTTVASEDETRQTVLVVEDHPDIRRSVLRLLEPEYRTVPAPEGRTGLELARRLLPDLVVADVSMPEMDGFEMARRLAADPETEGIPVLFLTARASPGDAIEGFAAGGVAYVRKPFSGETLRAQVASLLDRQRRLQYRLQEARSARGDEARDDGGADLASRARSVILERLHDESFGPAELGRALAMGRSKLFERFSEELATTPAELLRAVRLERGRELLSAGEGSVAEVSYAVGFTSRAGFSRAYRERYGELPSATLAGGRD